MTLEKKAKFIKKSKEKNYLYISPKIIKGGATLVESYETLELYENMDKNTKKFAEKEIVNLISNANYYNKEVKNYLNFNLFQKKKTLFSRQQGQCGPNCSKTKLYGVD